MRRCISAAPFYSVLIRVNPDNPASTTDFVCDLCTGMPTPTDGGKTYTFKIRQGVKFHDGAPLTAADVAKSWQMIVFPPEGVLSPRQAQFRHGRRIENPDPETVVFRLKFATTAFLPALADPFAWIYKKEILEKDPHWYEKNIMGSGPFKFAGYETGQSIKGVRNPDYYYPGRPYLDGSSAIYAPKQATRVEAIRADRAAIEFRGLPPASRDELKKQLGDRIAVQESDWNCGSVVTINHEKKPFDDVARAPRADLGDRPLEGRRGPVEDRQRPHRRQHHLSGLSRWRRAKEQLHEMAGFWTDIEKSRAEARRLLKEAGAENLELRAAEPRRRPAVQICRHLARRRVEQDRRQGRRSACCRAGRGIAAERAGDFDGRARRPIATASSIRSRTYASICRASITENYGNYEDPTRTTSSTTRRCTRPTRTSRSS